MQGPGGSKTGGWPGSIMWLLAVAAYRSNRESLRSLSTRPAVWQLGQ